MPIKVKTTLKLKDITRDAQERFNKNAAIEIIDLIIAKITSGQSPVKGYGRFTKYSDDYSKKKGRKQPVDFVLSGRFLESLRAQRSKGVSRGRIRVFFKDEKLFKAHNNGEGKNPVRRLLPTKTRETFKNDIMKKIVSILNNAVKQSIKR